LGRQHSLSMASSIKDRIAALNIEQVHAPAPSSRPTYSYDQATAKKKPPPPPPGRPSVPQRQQTINNPPIQSNATTSARHLGNEPAAAAEPKRSPALPPRPPPRNNSRAPPSLPPRQPSEPALRRRESNESITTVSSGISSLSLGSAYLSNSTSNGDQRFHIRAPAYDPNKLPPLPTRAKEAPKEESSIRKMMASKRDASTRSPVALPPTLPSRPAVPTRPQPKTQERRNLPPPPKSALEWGMNKATEAPPPLPSSRPSFSAVAENGAPSPVPMGSRPNLNAIMASKPKPGARPQVPSQSGCLICRDFSEPDHHAAQFPRQTLPSSDAGWLAQQLTSPFSSLTDRARVIFTWLHHNVEYDTYSFFSGNVSRSTPERTITTGLAVCEGYASLFAALALKAGLECVVVSGHGKGYGHSALKPGDPIPAFSVGHAWNAVRIDNWEWKLLDACWGAGNVCGEKYEKSFKPSQFTMSNEDFGSTHYPENNSHLFRTDGRTFPWEEYMMDDAGDRLTIYSDADTEGLNRRTFQPSSKHIKVNDLSDPMIRFQFNVVCPHWTGEKNGKGKPYIMALSVGGRDGRNAKKIPFNTDGKVWWLDIERRELGCMGQKINICCITEFDGRSGRGLTMTAYKNGVGRVGMKMAYISAWELV
jgi:transglutaminase-like putative cysteine protease